MRGRDRTKSQGRDLSKMQKKTGKENERMGKQDNNGLNDAFEANNFQFSTFFFFFFFCICFLGPRLWCMEVPRLGDELEL